MFEFFPGHYRWSYNTLLAFSAGGQLGDFALIEKALHENVGKDEAWHREWARLADILEKRAKAGSRSPRRRTTFFRRCITRSRSISFRRRRRTGSRPIRRSCGP